MARKLTPERQKLKQEAISLRYDYGWTIRSIAGQLHLPKTVIHRYVSHNSHSGLSHNSNHIRLLEGDCLELLKDIPDNINQDFSITEEEDGDKRDDG